MDVVTQGIRDQSPWWMLFADDVILCSTTQEVVEEKLEEWKREMENRGLKISRKNTEYLRLKNGKSGENKNLDWENIGININGEYPNKLRFADDIVLFTELWGELQNMIDLIRESRDVRLKMNISKTKIMFHGNAGNK
ncbi:uncharacterized protein [Palaemon carinicauda]|uniref:uncharacterized protein n=1 Tax=Palaemon carinicauda TaxID=392227 RepID=UPI0035B6A3AB